MKERSALALAVQKEMRSKRSSKTWGRKPSENRRKEEMQKELQ